MGLIHYEDWKRLAERSEEAKAIEVKYKAFIEEMDAIFDLLKDRSLPPVALRALDDRYEFVLYELDRLEAEGKALLNR
jgi:NAD-specific glutamate dehydrogenase